MIKYGGVVLHMGNSTLAYGDGKTELTRNEIKILQLLMEAKGNTVGRDTIIEKLWESESFIDDNTLTVNIARLRKKLEGVGLESFIATQKGVGYQAKV